MTLSRFERMVAIPEEEYQHLKTLQQSNVPLQSKFHSLQNEYRKQSFIPDAYARVQRQGETLNEMVKVKDDLRKQLVESTPKPYQSRAQSLFHFVENKMMLNEKGEVVDNDGAIIHGSNIADLVQHAVRDRRRNIVPAGWSHFINILRDSNAPRMIMNYDTLEELHTFKGETNPAVSPFKFTGIKTKPLSASKRAKLKQELMDVTPKRIKSPRAKLKHELMDDTSKRIKSSRARKSPAHLKDYMVARKKKYF